MLLFWRHVQIGGIVKNTLRPPVPESCDSEWRKLMEECWSLDPERRPSFTEITSRLRSMSMSLQARGNYQAWQVRPSAPWNQGTFLQLCLIVQNFSCIVFFFFKEAIKIQDWGWHALRVVITLQLLFLVMSVGYDIVICLFFLVKDEVEIIWYSCVHLPILYLLHEQTFSRKIYIEREKGKKRCL